QIELSTGLYIASHALETAKFTSSGIEARFSLPNSEVEIGFKLGSVLAFLILRTVIPVPAWELTEITANSVALIPITRHLESGSLVPWPASSIREEVTLANPVPLLLSW